MSNLESKVTVYDKNNKLLAIFTNDFPANTLKSINLMIDPTVNIVQNGESTFSFSINYNSEKWKNIKDPLNIYVVNGRKYTALNENSFVYNNNIVNVNLVETWYLLSKKYVQAYNVPKDREGIDEHTVVILPKSEEPLIVNGKQYNNNPYPRGSAGYALWALLRDSGWELGICDVMVDGFSPKDDYGVFNLESDQKDLLHNIQLVQQLWGGILVWDSMNQIVHLRDENKWQPKNGFQIREGKNAKNGIKITQNNDVITRLYPLGEAKLNIKAVNNGKTYVENFSYTKDVYSRIVQNSNIYDQKQLKFWGERKLSEMCKPSRFIEVDILDLRTTEGYEFEQFELNDIAQIVTKDQNTGEEIIEEQRIIGWSYKVFAIYDSKIELGNKTKNIVEILKQAYDNSEKADDNINDSGNISSDSIWDRTDGTNLPGLFHKCYTYIHESDHQLSIHINDVEQSLADFTAYAGETYATIVSVTEFKTEVSNSFTQISQYVDGNFAQISLLATYEIEDGNGKSTSISQISMTASANRASINSLTSLTSGHTRSISKLEQTVTNECAKINALASYQWKDSEGNYRTLSNLSLESSENGAKIGLVVEYKYGQNVIKAASIVTAVNKSESSVKINADKIDITGSVRFIKPSDLDKEADDDSDTTKIDGGLIKTRTIDAECIKSDTISSLFVSAVDANVKGTLRIRDGGRIYLENGGSLYISTILGAGKTKLMVGNKSIELIMISSGILGTQPVLVLGVPYR